MKKTKLVGAALSAIVVGLVAAGCSNDVVSGTTDPAIQNKNNNEIKVEDNAAIENPQIPGATENGVTADALNMGKRATLWYGRAVGNNGTKSTVAIAKFSPFANEADAGKYGEKGRTGMVEIAIVDPDAKSVANASAPLRYYTVHSENKITASLSHKYQKGEAETYEVFFYPEKKEVRLVGDGAEWTLSCVGNYGNTDPALTDVVASLASAPFDANALNYKHFSLHMQPVAGTNGGEFTWSGNPKTNGTYELKKDEVGNITIAFKNKAGQVLNRVKDSVVVENTLWIAFDSATLADKNTGLTFPEFASNVPFLFSSENFESLISSK